MTTTRPTFCIVPVQPIDEAVQSGKPLLQLVDFVVPALGISLTSRRLPTGSRQQRASFRPEPTSRRETTWARKPTISPLAVRENSITVAAAAAKRPGDARRSQAQPDGTPR